MKINKKTRNIIIVAIIVIAIALFAFIKNRNGSTTNNSTENSKPLVKVLTVSKSLEGASIETSGTIKPMKTITIKALANGTVQDVLADQGQEVKFGQGLAYMYDEPTETNYSSAFSSFTTAQNSYDTTLMSSQKMIDQAKLANDGAKESLESAKLSLENAIDSTINANISYLNSTENLLNFVDGILGVDNAVSYSGLESVFSVKNSNIKNQAKAQYEKTKSLYEKLKNQEITKDNAKEILNKNLSLTREGKTLIDLTISGLYASVSSSDFPQISLSSLTSSAIAQQTAISGLISSELANQNQIDKVESGLKMAQTSLQSSQTALTNAEENKTLTINGAENAMRAAKSAYDLASIAKSRLNISAPFNGVISKKSVEIGDQVSIGQPLFEISVVDYVKVEISIPAESKTYINIGDEVLVNENIKANITRIDPIADPMTKKIQIEVGYDNSKLDLVPESFAKVKISLKNFADKENVFIIPLKAVDLGQDSTTVKIVKDNKIETRNIEYTDILNDKIAVKSGLSDGDQVIVENGKMLSAGTEVTTESY